MWDGEMWGCCRMVERWHDEIVEMWNDGIVDCVGRWICGSLLLLLLLYCFFTCAGEFEALAYVAVFFFCYVCPLYQMCLLLCPCLDGVSASVPVPGCVCACFVSLDYICACVAVSEYVFCVLRLVVPLWCGVVWRGAGQVLVLLFLLMTVFPDSVFLNRGNHEDFGLCCVYGFQKECLAKYNDVVFR